MRLSRLLVVFSPVKNQMAEVGKPSSQCSGSVPSRDNRASIVSRPNNKNEEAHGLPWEEDEIFSKILFLGDTPNLAKAAFEILKMKTPG